MKDLEHIVLEEKTIELLDFIFEACNEAIESLDRDNYATASFKIGLIYGAAKAFGDKINNDDQQENNE